MNLTGSFVATSLHIARKTISSNISGLCAGDAIAAILWIVVSVPIADTRLGSARWCFWPAQWCHCHQYRYTILWRTLHSFVSRWAGRYGGERTGDFRCGPELFVLFGPIPFFVVFVVPFHLFLEMCRAVYSAHADGCFDSSMHVSGDLGSDTYNSIQSHSIGVEFWITIGI